MFSGMGQFAPTEGPNMGAFRSWGIPEWAISEMLGSRMGKSRTRKQMPRNTPLSLLASGVGQIPLFADPKALNRFNLWRY